MTLLITGGTGFLGSYLARHAVEEREQVVLFDRYPSDERIAEVADSVTVVTGDVLEPQELIEAVNRFGVQKIAHLAFLAGPSTPEKVVPYLRTQCMGTANVFEAARVCGLRRVVNASSAAVFGHRAPLGQATEDAPARPDDLYGTCKLWSEDVARYYNERHSMEILSLRVCSSMGLGRVNRASLISRLVAGSDNFLGAPELAAAGRPVIVPPDGYVFDFIYAADTALAFWLALTAPCPSHAVLNVCAEQRSAGDFTQHLLKLLPDTEVERNDSGVVGLQLLDNTRIVEELGFKPRYTLETGLEDYVARVAAISTAAR